MRYAVVIATFLLAVPSVAEAACSTASVAGDWLFTIQNGRGQDICPGKLTSTGNLSGKCLSGLPMFGKIAVDSRCKITGSVVGATFTGRTDTIPVGSALVPNLMMGYGPMNAAGSVHGFRK